MATPQPPTNPFDGFDTYSTVVQQPPAPAQQSYQQQDPFAAPAMIVDDGNPFAMIQQQQQQQQPPSPPHPQQSQPQLYNQQSQPAFYQQQMIPVAASAVASPWAMQPNQQQQQQQLLAPQQNNNGTIASSSPWGVQQSQLQQQPFPHVASPALVDPLIALFGGGQQNQQVQLHTQQTYPYALQQQPHHHQQQQTVEEVRMFDFEMTTNNENNTSLLISKEEEEGLALVDVELDDNDEGEDRKNDGDFLGEDGLNGSDVPTPKITKEGKTKTKKKSSTEQQQQQQQHHQPWDRNPNIAPPPPRSASRPHAEYLSTNSASPQSSPLPKYELVYHAGYVLSRISFRTVLMRKWKQSFWIQYGPTSVLFFRSFTDYDDWLNNPYHTMKAREFLVKLRIDFVGDLKKPNVMGYQVTQIRKKPYGRNTMLHFKLERWMDYGPTIAAAFAAREDDMINSPTHHRNGVTGGNGCDSEDGFNTTNDVTALRKIILGCMRNARDYAMIASRESEQQMEAVTGVSAWRINDEEARMRGRYDNEYENRTMSPTTSTTRIPASTRNMGFHQAFSAEASERRRMGVGESPDDDDGFSEEESSRNRDMSDKEPVVPPVVDLLG